MRRFILILFAFFTASLLNAQNYYQLDSLMEVYVRSMQPEGTETKLEEVDYMISASKDSLTRQHIALKLFDYYKASPLMGEEEIAVHIYDNWFANGRIKMRSEFDEMDAKLFADFNRSSLIGMDASLITLRKPCGGRVTIPEKGKNSLIWFYDTACSKCQVEAKVLPGILDKEAKVPFTFYAVYSGQDGNAWKKFRKTFKISNRSIKVVHLWDPGIESDYLRLYGVISTPKMYYVEPRGTIMGRRLEVESLPQIFDLMEEIDKLYRK